MAVNLLIVHGGGPTAVLNASLYGAIMEAKQHKEIQHIYGARNGTGGLLKNDLIELEQVDMELQKLLLQTPGSAIGTSRDPLGQEEYDKMATMLIKKNIRYVLFNGGNGTMDACGNLYRTCFEKGVEAYLVGIPKTMDNDIAITDHSPGFGSAARYLAESVKEVCADVKSLPIHVVVIEASGRNAGWITAASALAGAANGCGPDLIYLPERIFNENKFITDVERLFQKKKGIVIVASEGLKKSNGDPIVEPIYRTERAIYFGDVSTHLANLVVKHLGYKARGEKPGLLGRASISLQSPIDRAESELAGRVACRAALDGESGKMVAFRRVSNQPYQMEPYLIDIEKVMMHEKTVPDIYINAEGNGVTPEFIDWCKPLIGVELTKMISFND